MLLEVLDPALTEFGTLVLGLDGLHRLSHSKDKLRVGNTGHGCHSLSAHERTRKEKYKYSWGCHRTI
jgi:hypothetical protein